MHLRNHFQTIHSALLTEELNLEGQWAVAISEVSYPSMYQKVTQGKLMFFFLKKKLLKSSEFHNLESGNYPPITDNVEAMITPILGKSQTQSKLYRSYSVSKNAKS